MKDRAVVYATDPGFLVPSLVSALEVRRQAGSIADIVIFLTGFPEGEGERIATIVRDLGLTAKVMAGIALSDDVHFNRTHVPVSALARLSLPGYIDPAYRHIIYLDGDIRVVGDIVPLLSHTVKEGSILAANDNMWLGYHIRRRRMRAYYASLGLKSEFDYFNSGVLALRRETMDQMFPKAMDYFLNNSQLCLYHDQSALNAVFSGRREVLSPRYNFISDYALLDVQDEVDLSLIHFTGGGKPWVCNGAPWNGRFLAPYADIIRENPQLAAYAKPFDQARSDAELSYYERRKRFYKIAFPIYALRRMRFHHYMKKQEFAC